MIDTLLRVMDDDNLPSLDFSSDPILDFDYEYADQLFPDVYWFESTNRNELQPMNRSEFIDDIPSAINPPRTEEEDLPSRPDPAEEFEITVQRPIQLSVMERLAHALNEIKCSTGEGDILIQIWVPVIAGSMRVLTTDAQPFSSSQRLAGYRDISVRFQFAADENSNASFGMPGRVFFSRVPEWTPDVRFFSRDEYPRVEHACQYNVCGGLALPVFGRDNISCLGVIEVVMTTQKINYQSEIESVCKALKAVNLRSSEVFIPRNVKGSSGDERVIIPEILQIMESACMTHQLPLAQTWVSCIQQGKGGSRHSDTNYESCVSTLDSACCVGDSHVRPFQEACSEHHLFKGQGVAGRAFLTNHHCFSPDITKLVKTEYPLSHHARVFGLHAAAAVRMQSMYTGADYVLEFFLPLDCEDPNEQESIVNSLVIIVRQGCKNLCVTPEEVHRNGCELEPPPRKTKGVERDINCTGVNEGNFHSTDRKRSKAEKNITLEILQQHFSGNLKDAARTLGVCPTTLKRICRHHGIKRWPSRKIKKVGNSLQKLQQVISSVQCSSGTIGIGSFYSNFPKLAPCARERPQQNTNRNNMVHGEDQIGHQDAVSKLQSPSSGASSSSHCYSSGDDHPASPDPDATNKDDAAENCKDVMAKRADNGFWRVKVSFRDEKVRFRMDGEWSFHDLHDEIEKRFSLESQCFRIKYLDDDSEWILFNCDADLEECIDTCISSGEQTIKLSIHA